MAYENVILSWTSSVQNKTFKLDIDENDNGLWRNGKCFENTSTSYKIIFYMLDDVNIQVMFANGNYSILLFCDSRVLFSLVLISTNITITETIYDFEFAEDIIKDSFLSVEGVKFFSTANVNFINWTFLLICYALLSCSFSNFY